MNENVGEVRAGWPGDYYPILGILGGMGPLATARFYSRLVERSSAKRDQDHPRVVVWSDPLIPDRTEFLIGTGEDPTPMLIAGATALKNAGADLVVMPCNTAAVFRTEIEHGAEIPVFDWVGAAAAAVAARTVNSVGLLATTGTVASGVYQAEFGRRSVETVVPSDRAQERLMEAIYGPAGVKTVSSVSSEAIRLFESVVDDVLSVGAESILLACTELPVITNSSEASIPVPIVDPGEEAISLLLDWFDRGQTEPRSANSSQPAMA